MSQNNIGTHIHFNFPEDFNMQQKTKLPSPAAVGVKGPWHLDPGKPNFPNHRPYLSNLKPQGGGTPAVAPQTLKFPGGE